MLRCFCFLRICHIPSIAPSSTLRYILHLIFFGAWITSFFIFSGALPLSTEDYRTFDPAERYGLTTVILLYMLRFLSMLALPQCICNSLGLVLFNNFKDKVFPKISPEKAPFICFRVVTKGDYPNLVKGNTEENINTCREVGLNGNFIFEVVTDKAIGLRQTTFIRETVVPDNYRTKSGARFKSRALQYCLEDGINYLQDNNWIVHLDEETILSKNSVIGVLNFCEDGKSHFGQGVIIYARGKIVNWFATLADLFRVSDDFGKLRYQLQILHRPLFGWKGSFVVAKAGAERKVTFDHGPEGSIAEDCFFSMMAYKDGYSFDFIEGEMYEKSPFTLNDFVKQRMRWLNGITLTVHSRLIPMRYKIFLATSCYAWYMMPLTTTNIFITPLFPLPNFFLIDIPLAFIGAVSTYMYIFGALKSFSNRCRNNLCCMFSFALLALLIIPFNVVVESCAAIGALLDKKNNFHIVCKEFTATNKMRNHQTIDV